MPRALQETLDSPAGTSPEGAAVACRGSLHLLGGHMQGCRPPARLFELPRRSAAEPPLPHTHQTRRTQAPPRKAGPAPGSCGRSCSRHSPPAAQLARAIPLGALQQRASVIFPRNREHPSKEPTRLASPAPRPSAWPRAAHRQSQQPRPHRPAPSSGCRRSMSVPTQRPAGRRRCFGTQALPSLLLLIILLAAQLATAELDARELMPRLCLLPHAGLPQFDRR